MQDVAATTTDEAENCGLPVLHDNAEVDAIKREICDTSFKDNTLITKSLVES